MALLAVWRWILERLLSRPAVVLALGMLVGWIPLLSLFREGLDPVADRLAVMTWCYPAGLIGTCAGLVLLGDGEAFLARLAPTQRWAGEVGGLVLSALVLQLPILLGAAAARCSLADCARVLPDILCADLRLAGVASMLLVPPLAAGLRVFLCVSTVCVLPAVIRGAEARVFDAGATLRAQVDPTAALSSSFVIACAWVLAAYLLRARPRWSPTR